MNKKRKIKSKTKKKLQKMTAAIRESDVRIGEGEFLYMNGHNYGSMELKSECYQRPFFQQETKLRLLGEVAQSKMNIYNPFRTCTSQVYDRERETEQNQAIKLKDTFAASELYNGSRRRVTSFEPDSQSKSKVQYWSHVEEVIFIGVIFNRLFDQGSLGNWDALKELYEDGLNRYRQKCASDVVFPDRTLVALKRHFKVMKARKQTPFRSLFVQYENLNLMNQPKRVHRERGRSESVPAYSPFDFFRETANERTKHQLTSKVEYGSTSGTIKKRRKSTQ
mmetsp:Transcript_12537/g.14388  ORF Transcript_12537/g.14388 Transcript_12537/m.14388 type:complete len:279 (+) Transcript_12537:172-1008(+)